MSHFIKQFAEKSMLSQPVCGMAMGTATSTRTIEGADQDASPELFSFLLGTGTGTKTAEGPDQDHSSNWIASDNFAIMGTGTVTESIEGTDQDRNEKFFFI